ncbi:ATP-dependent Zn protease [Mycena indigotica]|uniref:ATP-dependent Zn protease n=1 Tax=Mycena indigotica TaxID=2126181 RepID=A0A8H6SND6_9AGAR|nr:ATP-dependent Zn protease [Mycena indigotica]KAF7301826.1 ATP-dependent Zn protease [Mycena indigotica]
MANLTDDFINVWTSATGGNEFHQAWSTTAGAPHANPVLQAANDLRKLYPEHSLTLTLHDVIHFPLALFRPLPEAPMVTTTYFAPLGRPQGKITGVLVDRPEFFAASVAWDSYDFIVYAVTYPSGFGTSTLFCVLHQGPQEPARKLVLAAGTYSQSLHQEIWVYNQGFWQKDHELWRDIQSASWDDVILKEEFKTALKKDIYGFFKSEPIYKRYAIPWKRGIIMHGPPGNGKTISIKVVMKTCEDLGFAPLYVKSFQSWMGEEAAMLDVFSKARQLSPCVVVLEDLDALINDRNRSFFLNQLDGLQGNDGLLVVGTTNHFDRLDPGLSTRPSRFDRKYLFDDPSRDERALYAKYWQGKLKDNEEIDFPDSLVNEVADSTSKFSFAYLKEVFVSSLVTLAGYEGEDKPTFAQMLSQTIKTLRKQLDKMVISAKVSTESSAQKQDFRPLFDSLSGPSFMPTLNETAASGTELDFRLTFDRLSLNRRNDVVLNELARRAAESRLD